MTPLRIFRRDARRGHLIAAFILAGTATALSADVIERRSGPRLEGTVVSLDATVLVLQTSAGTTRVPRSDIVAITFAEVLPLKVEIKNVKSDDSVDVILDGEEVIREARDGGSWIDLTSRLKEGNNALRLRIRNQRGTWSYRIHLRVNGRVIPLECGAGPAAGAGCACCGKTGRELGVIDDLPEIWLHVDRVLGRAEVLP